MVHSKLNANSVEDDFFRLTRNELDNVFLRNIASFARKDVSHTPSHTSPNSFLFTDRPHYLCSGKLTKRRVPKSRMVKRVGK